MDKVGFALVGCGSIAVKHQEAIRQVESAELKAVYDFDQGRAQAFAGKYQTSWVENFNDLLKKDEIQVIDICAPSACHAELTIAAARGGKHVLVEKPMAVTLEDADQMMEACEKAGVYLGVVLQNRYKPAVQCLRSAVDGGFFGQLTHGTATVRWNRNQDYYRDNPWRGNTSLGGGVLMNQGIHNIDLLQWLMGEVDAVFAFTASRLLHLDAEDVAAGVIHFKNGALGTVEVASTIFPVNLEESLHIFGESGTVTIGGTRADKICVWKFAEDNQELLKRSEAENKGHLPMIEDMVRCVRFGKKPEVDGWEGRKSLEIVLAFHESARTKKMIYFA